MIGFELGLLSIESFRFDDRKFDETPMTKDERTIQCLKRILKTQELDEERQSIRRMLVELDVELLECAAALLYIHKAEGESQQAIENIAPVSPATRPLSDSPKMVRYRLAVGLIHGVSKDTIKDVLVDESGVERKMIGSVDIRHDFTIVELPEGMPEDIFQHLKSIEISRQSLEIKRLKANSNKRKADNARRRKKRSFRPESPVRQTIDRKEVAG